MGPARPCIGSVASGLISNIDHSSQVWAPNLGAYPVLPCFRGVRSLKYMLLLFRTWYIWYIGGTQGF